MPELEVFDKVPLLLRSERAHPDSLHVCASLSAWHPALWSSHEAKTQIRQSEWHSSRRREMVLC